MTNPTTQGLTPGTPTPISGIYERVDGMQVALSKDDRIPPGREGRHDTYTLVRPTKNRR